MSDDAPAPARLRWARLRFSIIAQLLASPPDRGELAGEITKLAARTWRHPTTGESVHFAAKTIERFLYTARGQDDPMRALERKVPKHTGTHPSVSGALAAAIARQYGEHPRWSYQLHYDNLLVVAKQDPSLGVIPTYATVRRFMKDEGLVRQRRKRHRRGGKAETAIEPRERRSYEVEHVHGLWPDFEGFSVFRGTWVSNSARFGGAEARKS